MRDAPLAQAIEKSWRHRARSAFLYVLLIFSLVPFVFPFFWLVMASLKTPLEIFSPRLLPASFQWMNLVEVFRFQPFGRYLFNSTYVALIVTAAVLILSLYAGYAFARLRFRGASLVLVVLLSALMMPSEVTIVPNFFLMQRLSLLDNHLSIILLPVFGSTGVFGVFLMRQFFLGFPSDVEEAARIDGLNHFGIVWRLGIPLAKPVLSALGVITFLNSWNLFLEPLVLISSQHLITVPVALASFVDPYGEPVWHLQLAATLISILPVIVVYLIAERHITDVLGSGGSTV